MCGILWYKITFELKSRDLLQKLPDPLRDRPELSRNYTQSSQGLNLPLYP